MARLSYPGKIFIQLYSTLLRQFLDLYQFSKPNYSLAATINMDILQANLPSNLPQSVPQTRQSHESELNELCTKVYNKYGRGRPKGMIARPGNVSN